MGDLAEIVDSNNFDIVGVTETWLHDDVNSADVSLPGFKFIRSDRVGRGGGVGLFVREQYRVKVVDVDFEFESPVECLWIQLSCQKLSIIVGVVYRPPNRKRRKSGFNSFVNDVDLMLNCVCPMADYIFCIGDVNVNLLNPLNPFSECFSSYGFDQVIREPTRVTLTSSFLLDPIFLKCPADFVRASGVMNVCHISDHRLAFCECSMPSPKRVQKFIFYRDFDHFDNEVFLSDLRSEKWHSFIREPNINKKVKIFNDILSSVYDRHAPVRRKRISKPKAPWLTEQLRGMMKRRDRALAAFGRSGSVEDWNVYKRMRNGTLAEIRRSKKSYLLAASSDGNEATWRALRSLNVSKLYARVIPECSKDAESISDFFSAFSGVAADEVCADKISYYGSNVFRAGLSFRFRVASLDQIRTIMTSIRSRAVGDDDITLDMLVHAFPVLELYIQHLVNSCIVAGVFPAQWKCAIGIPLPKTSEPTSFSDLSIISILPLLSKVLEKILSDQISQYVNDFNLLPSYQSGFRRNHSTATALASVTDRIFRDLDGGYSVLHVLLDFSKAFDTINHSLLCAKLKYFGFSVSAVSMIRSFLTFRSSKVQVDGRCAEPRSIRAGVPQGSILGPLLFIVYAADLFSGLDCCVPEAFADDVQLMFWFSMGELGLASARVNRDLEAILQVCKSHNLSINSAKTKCIVYCKRKDRNIIRSGLDLSLGGDKLDICDGAKNLGVYFDEDLRFRKHVSTLVKSAFYKLRILYSARKYLTFQMRKNLSEVLVLSTFNYCDIIYGPCLDSFHKRRIQLVQNWCCRFVFGLRKFDHVSGKIRDLGWLRMESRVRLHMGCFVFRLIRNPIDGGIMDHLVPRSAAHSVNIRYPYRLTIPPHRTAGFRRCFSFNAAKVMNAFDIDVSNFASFFAFRTRLKSFLFARE